MPDPPPTKENASALLIAGALMSAFGLMAYFHAVNSVEPVDGEFLGLTWWREKGSAFLAFFGFLITGFGIHQMLLVVGPSPLPWPVRFALWLIRRVTPGTVLAAVPYVALGGEYLLAWKLGASRRWADPDWLASLVTMELFAIMLSPLFGAGLWAFLKRNQFLKGTPAKTGCWAATLLGTAYLALIAWAASKQDGVGPVLTFVYLVLAKIIPLWQARWSPRLVVWAGARGVASLVLMFGILSALSTATTGTPFELAVGFWYFTILALLELVDTFQDKVPVSKPA